MPCPRVLRGRRLGRSVRQASARRIDIASRSARPSRPLMPLICAIKFSFGGTGVWSSICSLVGKADFSDAMLPSSLVLTINDAVIGVVEVGFVGIGDFSVVSVLVGTKLVFVPVVAGWGFEVVVPVKAIFLI